MTVRDGLAHHGDRPAVDDRRLGEVELGAALEHPRLDAGRAAEGEHGVVVARVGGARVQEERDVARAARAAPAAAAASAMVAAQQHALALVAHDVGLEPVARGRAAHEPSVDRALAHGVEDLRRWP